jgi:hypothetical protein
MRLTNPNAAPMRFPHPNVAAMRLQNPTNRPAHPLIARALPFVPPVSPLPQQIRGLQLMQIRPAPGFQHAQHVQHGTQFEEDRYRMMTVKAETKPTLQTEIGFISLPAGYDKKSASRKVVSVLWCPARKSKNNSTLAPLIIYRDRPPLLGELRDDGIYYGEPYMGTLPTGNFIHAAYDIKQSLPLIKMGQQQNKELINEQQCNRPKISDLMVNCSDTWEVRKASGLTQDT